METFRSITLKRGQQTVSITQQFYWFPYQKQHFWHNAIWCSGTLFTRLLSTIFMSHECSLRMDKQCLPLPGNRTPAAFICNFFTTCSELTQFLQLYFWKQAAVFHTHHTPYQHLHFLHLAHALIHFSFVSFYMTEQLRVKGLAQGPKSSSLAILELTTFR